MCFSVSSDFNELYPLTPPPEETHKHPNADASTMSLKTLLRRYYEELITCGLFEAAAYPVFYVTEDLFGQNVILPFLH